MAKTSARMAFMAPSISLVAFGDSPVGVARADTSFAVTADLADFLVFIFVSLVEPDRCISVHFAGNVFQKWRSATGFLRAIESCRAGTFTLAYSIQKNLPPFGLRPIVGGMNF